MKQVEVILGFDMETDIGSWTHDHRGVAEGTEQILRLLQKYSVPATYFWVGETARRFPSLVKDTASGGNEAGCHSLFHETVGNPIFDTPGVYPVRTNELQDRLIENKRIVDQAAGRPAVSFRAPRLFGSTELVNVLSKIGFIADASYPLYHFGNRLSPYRPSADDWTQEGSLELVEIPNFADVTMRSQDAYGRDRDQWPLLRTAGADVMGEKIEDFVIELGRRKVERPVVCIYLHPWEFVPMPQGEIFIGEGYVRPLPFLVENCGTYALNQLERLVQLLLEKNFIFTTCENIAASCLRE